MLLTCPATRCGTGDRTCCSGTARRDATGKASGGRVSRDNGEAAALVSSTLRDHLK